jgi:hypothetical protein
VSVRLKTREPKIRTLDTDETGFVKARNRTVDEVRALAESVRERLTDPELSMSARYRWEGALAALEAVLNEGSSQVPGLDLTSLL